jgi:ribonuclease D
MVTMVEGDFPSEWIHGARAAQKIGIDIETSGLSPTTDRIACIQMYVPGMGTVMVRNLINPRNLITLLQDRLTVKIFHHAPFDLAFIQRNYDVLPAGIACTKIAAKLVDPQRLMFFDPDTNKGSHSLKSIVWTMFQDRLDKSIAVSNWFVDDLSPEQIDYAAKDVEYLPEILRRLELELSKQRLLRQFRKASNFIPVKIDLELKNVNDVYGYT